MRKNNFLLSTIACMFCVVILNSCAKKEETLSTEQLLTGNWILKQPTGGVSDVLLVTEPVAGANISSQLSAVQNGGLATAGFNSAAVKDLRAFIGFSSAFTIDNVIAFNGDKTVVESAGADGKFGGSNPPFGTGLDLGAAASASMIVTRAGSTWALGTDNKTITITKAASTVLYPGTPNSITWTIESINSTEMTISTTYYLGTPYGSCQEATKPASCGLGIPATVVSFTVRATFTKK